MNKFSFNKFVSVLEKNGVIETCDCTVHLQDGTDFLLQYNMLDKCINILGTADVRAIDVRIDNQLFTLATFLDGDFFISKFWVDEHDVVRSEVLHSLMAV